MKVLVYGDAIFSLDMLWGFNAAGHDAELVVPRSALELAQKIDAAQPDLLITLGTPVYYPQEIRNYLFGRKRGRMKHIHWDTDGISWKEIEMSLIHSTNPDMVFTVCPDMLAILQGESIKSELLFYAYCPLYHHPLPAQDAGQITFVGASYIQVMQKFPEHFRRRSMDVLFEPLLRKGTRIDFFGDTSHGQLLKYLYGLNVPYDWIHGRVPYDKLSSIYCNSHINLVTQNHEQTITKRTFEILGSGGFILTCRNKAIDEFFTPGRDLAASDSPEQTLELLEYYNSHEGEYAEIRKKALESAQNHTYKQRVEEILDKMKDLL